MSSTPPTVKSLFVVLAAAALAVASGAACGGSIAGVGSSPDGGTSTGDDTDFDGGGGGGSDGGGGTHDAGGGDHDASAGCASATPTTTTGDSVWSSCVTVLTADDEGGGFVPTPPPGSTCASGAAHYEYDVDAAAIHWSRCRQGATAKDPYTTVSGVYGVSASDAKAIASAAANVRVSSLQSCGADKPLLTLSVTTPAGEQTYEDEFYACNTNKVAVSNLDELLATFDKLTQ